ncbi:cystin-1 [Apus apus]|uniref:cystin-1 n=1 Tax=Apus apus TaxID=8895 RepID=UPI0021F86F40|nr:cystin-1 [Apus apus]
MGSGSSRRRGAAGRAVPAGGAAAAAAAAAAAGEKRQLLETVPGECGEAAALPAPCRPAPAAGGIIPPPRDGGEAAGDGGGTPPRQAALSARSPPGLEDTANHQCPQGNSKEPSGQSTISYDYAEEELMASIEREYCR